MTSRSIVLGTAAVLLMSAATPLHIGFSPTVAYAQQLTLEAAMAGNPSEFNAEQLRERIQLLRAAIEDGTLQGANHQAARQKVQAYRRALEDIRAERQEARQGDGQAEQPRQGQRTQRQPNSNANERAMEQSERQAERRAQREAERQAQREAERQGQRQAEQREAERQAERQAQRQAEQREAERQAQRQAERQAQREAERQAQREAERQAQREAERQAQREAEQREAQRQAERQAQREAERQGERQAQREAERQAERQAQREAQRQAEQREAERQAERQAPRQAERQPAPEDVNRRAREIIADNRSAADLDNQALRQRLNQNRELLGTDQLSRAQTRDLRQQLRADREELRSRVASRQDEDREARPGRSGSGDQTRGSRDRSRDSDDQTRGSRDRSRDSDDQPRRSRDRSRDSGDRFSDRDVARIIEERTPSDQLTERELEERVRVLSRALNTGNITVRQAEVARLLVDRDRNELRRRLHADRDHRRDRRRGGYRDNVVVEFEVGYRPPPVIYAAEAMPRDIQMQLVAPPRFQTQRAYSVREIATNHDVREMMPGIEIDTLNFDFGSAVVRPEEIDKLDEIGIVIESIVAERPDEVFLIEGHTDAVGSHEANDALSQRRAQAVVEALLDYFIIDPENLQTVGLGKRYLKINTPEAEEENRRVTVRRITPLLAGRG